MQHDYIFFLNILPPYRIGLYNLISKKLNKNVKFYFDAETEVNRKWINIDSEIDFNYEIINSISYNKKTKISNETFLERSIYFPLKIFPILKKENPKNIITLEMGLRTIFCIIFSKIFKKRVFILSEITENSEKNISCIKLLVRKIILRNINGAISHGTYSKEYLMKLGLEETKIIISPDSIDNNFYSNNRHNYNKISLRKKYDFDINDFIFLYVGQFIHRKGIDLLIKSFNKIKKSNIKLIIIGGTENEIQQKMQINSLENIIIFDFVQKDILIEFYLLADCLVLPTRNDVWGLVVNEAIACGLPVLVSKYAGCSIDLVKDKSNGYIFDPLNENEFNERLKDCYLRKLNLDKVEITSKKILDVFNHEIAAENICKIIKQ